MLLQKYPGYPADEQNYFIDTILSNPKHKRKAEAIEKEERRIYKQEQQASKLRRQLKQEEEKIKIEKEEKLIDSHLK